MIPQIGQPVLFFNHPEATPQVATVLTLQALETDPIDLAVFDTLNAAEDGTLVAVKRRAYPGNDGGATYSYWTWPTNGESTPP
jgi:hypothetical protein